MSAFYEISPRLAGGVAAWPRAHMHGPESRCRQLLDIGKFIVKIDIVKIDQNCSSRQNLDSSYFAVMANFG